MSPTIVFGPDGKVRLAVGAAGGATIIAQVAKAIVGVIDWDLSAQDAIALPVILRPADTRLRRARHVARGDDPGAAGARPRRHPARDAELKANAIEWKNGRWIGAADPRSEGAAVSE